MALGIELQMALTKERDRLIALIRDSRREITKINKLIGVGKATARAGLLDEIVQYLKSNPGGKTAMDVATAINQDHRDVSLSLGYSARSRNPRVRRVKKGVYEAVRR